MAQRAILFCLIVLTACSRRPEQQKLSGDASRQARPGYAEAATVAMTRLRDSLNSGKCDAVYADASEEFRRLESRDDWMKACGQLRTDLGAWAGYNLRSANFLRGSVVAYIEGTAAFSTGLYRLRILWNIESGEARLLSLSLGSSGETLTAPPAPWPARRLIDPPPEPRRAGRAITG